MSEASGARRAVSSHSSRDYARLHRQQALALQLFAGKLASAANRLRSLPISPFGRLFILTAQPHLAKHALALHFPLQNLKSLVHIVVAHENLHSLFLCDRAIAKPLPGARSLARGTHHPLADAAGMPTSILNFPSADGHNRLPYAKESDLPRSLFGQLFERVSTGPYTPYLSHPISKYRSASLFCVFPVGR